MIISDIKTKKFNNTLVKFFCLHAFSYKSVTSKKNEIALFRKRTLMRVVDSTDIKIHKTFALEKNLFLFYFRFFLLLQV